MRLASVVGACTHPLGIRYEGGTRAPITTSKISRSASAGLLWLLILTATTVPSACSALPNAKAAETNSSFFPGSIRISTPGIAAIEIPAGGLPTEGAATGTYFQPAFSKVTYSDSQNARPSSAPWDMSGSYRWPANGFTAPTMACWRAGPSVRGVFSFSNASWAFAASALASSPRALASATAFSNVLACSLALAASAVASAMCASDSAWTLSATLYSTKEEARETARAAAPNTAPTNISRSPQRSQTDAGNPQSIDWSVIAFFIYMTIFAAMAIATGFFSILAIRKRRGRF